jgi:hypothetical protein
MAQHVGKPRDPSSTEYLYVRVWENVESIQAFAGERWEEAVITPGWTGMRAAAAGVPGLNRYREPRVWWRHGSHDAVARLEVQVGARLTTFEPTANADENVGRNVALVHRRH